MTSLKDHSQRCSIELLRPHPIGIWSCMSKIHDVTTDWLLQHVECFSALCW
jgi:hypothetical protein